MSLFGRESSAINVLSFPEVVDQWSKELEHMFEYSAEGRPEYSPDEIDVSNYISMLSPYLPSQTEHKSFDDFVDDPGIDEIHDAMTVEINLGSAFGEAASAERSLAEAEIESLLNDVDDHFSSDYYSPHESNSDIWDVDLGTRKSILMPEVGFRLGARNHQLVADAYEPMSINLEEESRYDKVFMWPGADQMSQMKNLPVFNQWVSYDS